jgi:hypothetical protein
MAAKIRRNKLEIQYSFDFELVGIRTSLKGYKLAWQLNQALRTHLVRQQDLEISLKNGSVNFDHFGYQTSLNSLHLFRNHAYAAENPFQALVPEFPHFDYILMTQSEEALGGNRLQEYLRSLASVEWAALIPLSVLKSKENFIF